MVVGTNNGTGKYVSILISILLVLIGFIWSETQKQIEKAGVRIDDLNKTIHSMELAESQLMDRIDYLQYQLDALNKSLSSLNDNLYNSNPNPNSGSKLRFERK